MGLSAGEVDFGSVLRDDNPPPAVAVRVRPARVSNISWQVTEDREFAGTRLTKLADHQRSGRRNPFDQCCADRRSSPNSPAPQSVPS
jgi:hypothetical protein